MTINKEITKQKQLIARCENSIVSEKLKKRRADTRRKIELGGLVIKAGMDSFDKSIILGALIYTFKLMHQDSGYKDLFENEGSHLFLIKIS